MNKNPSNTTIAEYFQKMRIYKVFAITSISLVAIKSVPVPQMSRRSMSPSFTGAWILMEKMTFIHSFNAVFGIGSRVLTGNKGSSPPVTYTVDVKTRIGDMNSFRAYARPLEQRFPLMSNIMRFSCFTTIGQPRGQLIQVILFSCMSCSLSFGIKRSQFGVVGCKKVDWVSIKRVRNRVQ